MKRDVQGLAKLLQFAVIDTIADTGSFHMGSLQVKIKGHGGTTFGQYLEKNHTVLATGQSYQDAVAFCDHFVVTKSGARLAGDFLEELVCLYLFLTSFHCFLLRAQIPGPRKSRGDGNRAYL